MGKLHDPTAPECIYKHVGAPAATTTSCPTCSGDASEVEEKTPAEKRADALYAASMAIGQDRSVSDLLLLADWLLGRTTTKTQTFMDPVALNAMQSVQKRTTRVAKLGLIS